METLPCGFVIVSFLVLFALAMKTAEVEGRGGSDCLLGVLSI